MKKIAIALFLAVSCFHIAEADTVASVNGPISNFYDAGDAEYLAQSWTTTNAFSNVSISAALESTGDTALPATAWLLTALGPSTTAADILATTNISVPVGNTSELPLFSGLDLAAGTYYLLISGPGDLIDWQFTNNSNISTGAGTTWNGGQYSDFSNLDPAFPPGGDFLPYGDTDNTGIMLVTGDSTTATPEPGTWMLIGTGLLGLIGRGRYIRIARAG